jgi:hypothetical protein
MEPGDKDILMDYFDCARVERQRSEPGNEAFGRGFCEGGDNEAAVYGRRRAALVAFYRDKNAGKLASVDELLCKYRFSHTARSLQERYGEMPEGWEEELGAIDALRAAAGKGGGGGAGGAGGHGGGGLLRDVPSSSSSSSSGASPYRSPGLKGPESDPEKAAFKAEMRSFQALLLENSVIEWKRAHAAPEGTEAERQAYFEAYLKDQVPENIRLDEAGNVEWVDPRAGHLEFTFKKTRAWDALHKGSSLQLPEPPMSTKRERLEEAVQVLF